MGHSDSDKTHRQLLRTGRKGLVNVLISWGRVALCYWLCELEEQLVSVSGLQETEFQSLVTNTYIRRKERNGNEMKWNESVKEMRGEEMKE